MHEPFECTTPIRVVEVEGLGWEAALCDIEGESVLFLDVGLTADQRIEILTDAMAGRY